MAEENKIYVTEEGLKKLQDEYDNLVHVVREEVKAELAEARSQGDLSENFEYHAAKREQGKLLGRIRFRQRVLENARVLDASVLGSDTVGLLRTVEMTNLNNNASMAYTIVNPHEANLADHKISIKSPIAKALLGKKVGEVAEAHVPSGVLKLRIEKITL